jgi:transposase
VSGLSKKPNGPPRARRTFSAEFKAEAVALVRRRRAEGVALSQIGRELGIRPALLWEWARTLGGESTAPGSVAGSGRFPGETLEEENRRLRRENAILREEREFAKKAAVFFARESP